MEVKADACEKGERPPPISLKEDVIDIALEDISLNYERLRLCRPKALSFVETSLKNYGQLTPIVVGKLSSKRRYEMIDGFKRFHSARNLKLVRLRGRILYLSTHALKAAIVQLNYAHGSIGPFEEGLILNSLHREDGLKQNEIAVLFSRHKSWVCRRIAIVERLCEEAIDHLRLGLIGTGIGRELAQLPRGNQGDALKTVLKHRLCCRETRKLVNLLMTRPRWEHDSVLRFPAPILEARTPCKPEITQKLETPQEKLSHAVDLICKGCKRAEDVMNTCESFSFSDLQLTTLLNSLDISENHFNRIRVMMKGSIHAAAVH